jgi:hypothetical protein
MLAFPFADAEGLLGREVTTSGGAGMQVAAARAPGCDVTVRRSKAQFRTLREAKTSELVSVGATYAQVVSLEAKYGKESQAVLELENTEILEADLRGACGRRVVSKLFVGHGKRRVFAATEASATGGVGSPLVRVSPAVSSRARDVDELAWQDDQAYAFDVRELASDDAPPLTVNVRMPSIVNEGDEVRISFSAEREAWLVVFYVDADGKAEVLWPSNEEPAPHVVPAASLELPSPAERAAGIKIRPTLSKPGTAARERLVVYAFADRRDYDVAKPASGSTSADGMTFAEDLGKRLRNIPAARWSKTVLGYTIEPKK